MSARCGAVEECTHLGGKGWRHPTAAAARPLSSPPAQHLPPDGAVKVGWRNKGERVSKQCLLNQAVERIVARERWRRIHLNQPRLELIVDEDIVAEKFK